MAYQLRDEVRALISFFESASHDHLATFDELDDVAGLPVRENGNGWMLQSAIRVLGRGGIPIVSVRGVGYRRLAPSPGLDHVGSQATSKLRRVARAKQMLMSAILPHANDLSREDRDLAMRRMCALGLTELLNQPRAIKKLPTRVPEIDPFAQLREALGLKPGDVE